MRKNLFCQRVRIFEIHCQTAMEAKSVDIFKAEMNRFLISQGVKSCGDKAGGWGWEGKIDRSATEWWCRLFGPKTVVVTIFFIARRGTEAEGCGLLQWTSKIL